MLQQAVIWISCIACKLQTYIVINYISSSILKLSHLRQHALPDEIIMKPNVLGQLWVERSQEMSALSNRYGRSCDL
jgi:hypothetical protein